MMRLHARLLPGVWVCGGANRAETFTEGSGMGSLVRLFTVGAVTALSASALVVSPATADTSPVPAPPATNRASSAPETRGDARTTGLRIKIKGVSAGARASVTVTGPKQRTKGKRYSKVIHRSKTLKVRPGKYKITSGILGATGGIDVPKKATKTVRVRKNKIKTRTMRYIFNAATPVPPVTCAEGGTCVVGDTGRGGGTVFYVDYSRPTGSQVFEAAPNGWNTATPDADLEVPWGLPGVPGDCGWLDIGTATAIGEGKPNTNLITSTVACNTPAKAPAAWAAKDYNGGSQTDWFLPSMDELNQLCKWARGQSTTVAKQAVVCNNTGTLDPGFTLEVYWSSSEAIPPADAFLNVAIQDFINGRQFAIDRSRNTNPLRPIRTS
jgi:hypothetical protein